MTAKEKFEKLRLCVLMVNIMNIILFSLSIIVALAGNFSVAMVIALILGLSENIARFMRTCYHVEKGHQEQKL